MSLPLCRWRWNSRIELSAKVKLAIGRGRHRHRAKRCQQPKVFGLSVAIFDVSWFVPSVNNRGSHGAVGIGGRSYEMGVGMQWRTARDWGSVWSSKWARGGSSWMWVTWVTLTLLGTKFDDNRGFFWYIFLCRACWHNQTLESEVSLYADYKFEIMRNMVRVTMFFAKTFFLQT